MGLNSELDVAIVKKQAENNHMKRTLGLILKTANLVCPWRRRKKRRREEDERATRPNERWSTDVMQIQVGEWVYCVVKILLRGLRKRVGRVNMASIIPRDYLRSLPRAAGAHAQALLHLTGTESLAHWGALLLCLARRARRPQSFWGLLLSFAPSSCQVPRRQVCIT
jgi:hypothetical protein